MSLFRKLLVSLSIATLVFWGFSLPTTAAELTSGYTVKTTLTINNNPLVNNAAYGEGKFYVNPTYTFDDETILKNGDTLVYPIPSVFKVDHSLSQDILSPNGEVVAHLSTDAITNVATVTVTNADYFARLSEGKKLSFVITVVWNDTTPYQVPQNFTFLGAQSYTLTRVKIDEEPQGYSEWGHQNTTDPNYVNWSIRVNRDINNLGQVKIKDIIPEGQELVGPITGYYFENWQAGPSKAIAANDSSVVTIINANNFTINAGDLSNRGIYLTYRTLLTAPVDKVEKKVYNDIIVTSNGTQLDALVARPFAPISIVDGAGSGGRSDEVSFAIKKVLMGRSLQVGEFGFELVDDSTGQVVQTVRNTADGSVNFEKIKFSTVGDFTYTIREMPSGLEHVTDDADSDIKVTVKVVDNAGFKKATVTYDRTEFTNVYTAPTTTNTTTELTADTTTTTESVTTTVVAPVTTSQMVPPTPKKGKILPKTGEEISLMTTLIGIALLSVVFLSIFSYSKSEKVK